MNKSIAAMAASTLALAGTVAAAGPASAEGNASLASVLTSDNNQFDRNGKDFDVLTEAVLAVLAAKPDSPVKVLTTGDVALTAFIPTDTAFSHLVHSLTGRTPRTERATFKAVAGLGIDTVETVLLYHVIPGSTITSSQALKANGAKLTTAQGGTVKVQVTKKPKRITLVDKDPNARNPRVVKVDINSGNVQVAHAIDRVLRPSDL